MNPFAPVRRFISALFHRSPLERELDDELRAHIESRAADLVRSGIPPAEARRRAGVEFGGLERFKQECRDAMGPRFFESLAQDLRFGLRMLRKSPAFTLLAILTLALGIGANSAIFSAVDGILIQPLPYADSSHLVEIEGSRLFQGTAERLQGLSVPDLRDVQSQCSDLSEVELYGLYEGAKMLGGLLPDDVRTVPVTGDFFAMLGVRPLLGRGIYPSDTEAGAGQVAVLEYRTWQRDFGGDPHVVGKILTLERKPFQIVGVMPKDFRIEANAHTLWIPFQFSQVRPGRAWNDVSALARLRPGLSLAAANLQLKTLASRLAEAYPDSDLGLQLSAIPVKQEAVGAQLPTELLILLAAVGIVLLIACVNVCGMLLARSWTRNREVAIRQALGASRRRIVFQFLVESLVLSLAGGAFGLLVAVWLIPVLRSIAPAGTPRLDSVRLNAHVLGFTLAVSIATGILFGLAPALQASRERVGATLKEGLGGLLGGFSASGPRRLGAALVIVEIALAVILASGATLLARSLQRLLGLKLGYRTENILIAQPDLTGSGCDYDHQPVCRAATADILNRLRGIPGVEAAAYASTAPLTGIFGYSPSIEERWGPRKINAIVWYRRVSAGYFRVMDIPIIAGRGFTDADNSTSQLVAVVNRAFADRYFPGSSPLGRRMSMHTDKQGRQQWIEVVGEVGSGRDFDITLAPDPEFYLPSAQSDADVTAPAFFVRTAANPLQIFPRVREQIFAVDNEAVVGDATTMSEIVAEEQAAPRFRTLLLGAFGALGVLLAIVGIFGVTSYAVSRRTREIGIRLALGAQRAGVLAMVVREGMLLAAVGILIGLGGALALTRLLRSFLFEIQPNDPATFAGVAVAVALAALAASIVPARRAMRVDPMAALRNE